MNGDPFVLAIKYGKDVQMSHFTCKIPPFRSKLLCVLAERILRSPESKIFCTGMLCAPDIKLCQVRFLKRFHRPRAFYNKNT